MHLVVYINLDREIERRKYMEAQLSKLDIKYQRFPAVLGEQVPNELRSYFFNGGQNDNKVTTLKPGEVGCWASHLSVARAIVSGELQETVLVLEDDTLLPANLKGLLDEIVASAPEDWELIKLSGNVKRPVKSIFQLKDGGGGT